MTDPRDLDHAFDRAQEALLAIYHARATNLSAVRATSVGCAKAHLRSAIAALETEMEPTPIRAPLVPWPRPAA